ncbi:glycerophosphodiester phosphodiesterase [Paenibacillus nasutitermitis]|uniref:Glycerophosphoryl diester phosphodiesterase n=1 Tax=Paenibacillus nasutitermitis TaxID=1652958 RepID=A0A917DZL0_9BACL|nr:glycerophosphodiester phosphodiesterase [Paenibacillus nasutitermitis]GGD81913.1 glycerophosphoryl diester phosphodiesterase [Paenibacillus nasutitermitis]
MSERILTIAHRGAAGEAPENTMAAFQLALEQGCDAIELDVHLSRDGQLIVCHDSTIDRTSDGTGEISNLLAEELKRVDAGRWFGEQYAGERIPLLTEVFDLVPPGVMVNVEIKDTSGHRLEPVLLELLKREGRLDNVVVSSFDHESLALLKQLEERVKVGLLYDCRPVRHALMATITGFDVYSLHPKFKRLDQENIRECIGQGLQVYPYTINDELSIRRAIDYGVSGIISDYPARVKRLLAQ